METHSVYKEEQSLPLRESKHLFSEVIEMDRSEIVVRPEIFQGRDTKFAEETVAKILREGFDKSREPIVVWKAEDGKYVVISGHSRFEASRRLYEQGDESLATLPVKVFQGGLNEAMDYALLESNRTITQEGLKSDLRAYKRAKERGYNREYLKGIFKPESRLRLLEDISYLNENGSFLTFLDSPSEKSFPYLQRNAQWVGNIREHYPQLTDLHEEEMFRYLYGVDEDSASAGKKKLTITKDQFHDLINKKVSRLDFDPTEALNLDERVSTSALTDPAKEQLHELQQEIDKLVKERHQKDELIAQVIQQGKNELIEKFKERQSQINQLITRKLLDKQKIESEIGKIERTAYDLFSQEEQEPPDSKQAETRESHENQERKEEKKMSSTENLKKFAAFVQKHKSIDAYNDDGTLKATFGRMGKKALSELAAYLGLKEYKVDFNKGGIAVSGDLTLMGMFTPDKGVYIDYNKDGGDYVLYRTIKNMKDYSGGHNNYFKESELAEPEKIKEKVVRLLDINNATLVNESLIDNTANPNHDIEDYVPKDAVVENQQETQIAGSIKEKETKNLLTGGEWFKANPTKILGEEYQTTDRYNKPVTRVKGTMRDVIEGINVPGSYLPTERDPVLNIEIKPDLSQVLNDPVAKQNIEKVIEETKKLHAGQALAELYNEPEKPKKEYYSFEDILSEYNNGITEEEIKAWVWYKRKTGGYNNEFAILDPENPWSRYVVPSAQVKAHLTKWLRSGLICYSNGDFIPSVLYYAENIYQRQSQLLRDKDKIIKEYGKEQFDRQWKGLENVLPTKLSLTDPVIENRLFISPISDFVNEIKVARLSDGTNFAQVSPQTGNESSEGIELIEAFKGWLKALPKDEFKKSNEYNIVRFYLQGKTPPRHHAPEQKLRLQHAAKKEGDALFIKFMEEAITREDQLRIEHLWNSRYNGYIEPNYYKIPAAFTCSSTFKNKQLFIRPVQREALGFLSMHGSGCIAFDVGLGKTMTAILAIANALQSGMCKRPFIVVPNQTYKNWIAEIRGVIEHGSVQLTGILPQYQVNDLYNLSQEYIDPLLNKQGKVEALPEYSITVLTYEGFNKLGFGNDTWKMIGRELFEILNQGSGNVREQESLYKKIEELMGKGIKGGMVNIEDLGLDYMVVDEAHSMKKSFTQVKGEMRTEGEAAGTRKRSRYQIHSGTPSMIGLRGFMIAQYILRNNRMRNVVLLTATPFTNSPLEIYSILALIGYQQLERWGIKNIKTFFDVYIKTSLELVINAKLRPERKEVVLGFNNLIALQQLIFKFIIYRTGEDINIQRPNKIVLPRINYITENGQILPLPTEEQIGTNLPLTATQKAFMKDIEAYVLGEVELSHFCVNPKGLEDGGEDDDAEELDEADLDDEEKGAARVLRGLAFARQVCLSPYLYSCNPEGEPTYEKYIETSPKLAYVMECISSVKQYCLEHGLDMPGQVIYMNAGVDYFSLIKDYLVKKIGLKEDQVGIIRSGIPTDKKEAIKEQFLAGKIKVIIGSASIKEGINLQTRSTDLYDCWPDWNPTDIQQLAGRIWRFGNIYAHVRFTIPLMEDSINIFEFQKLQEKTSRINQIWHRAGKANSLKLEEMNPSEIKMGLVTDPYALARLLVKEDEERIRDDIANLDNQKAVLEEIRSARDLFMQYSPKLIEIVNRYKPSERGERAIETSMKLFREYLDDPDTSYLQKEQGQFIYDQVRKSNNVLKRGLVQVLAPKGFDLEFNYFKVAQKIESEIEELSITLEEKTGVQAVEDKAQEIIQERVKSNYRVKTVQERVEEFKRLNPMVLTELMAYDTRPEAIVKQMEQAERGKALETAVDNLEEMEAILLAMEEMAELVKEMETLQAAA